jgi:hypothetical protein
MSRSAWLAAVRSGSAPSRLATVGAIGAAAAVVAAPVAQAGTPAPAATSTGGTTPAEPDAVAGTPGRALTAARPLADSSTAGQPDFGLQKIRLGVQREDGATFPPGSTLVGATITISTRQADPITGEPVGDPQITHCTVTSDPLYPDASDGSGDAGSAEDPNPIADCTPDDAGEPIQGSYYMAGPGEYVTFTETGAPDGPGMLADTNSYTIKPCVVSEDPDASDPDEFSLCDFGAVPEVARNNAMAAPAVAGGGPAVVFVVRPKPPAPPAVVIPPPAAVDDTATTVAGTPVEVPVLANDQAHGGGALSISSLGAPAHGTAVVDGLNVRYTPAAGFVGTDTFTYTATTAYGSSTATVSVTVTAPAPSSSAPSTPAPTTSSASPTLSASPTRSLGVLPTSASRAPAPPLANTGAHTGDELGIGAGLVAVGGLLTFAGRRRRRAH